MYWAFATASGSSASLLPVPITVTLPPLRFPVSTLSWGLGFDLLIPWNALYDQGSSSSRENGSRRSILPSGEKTRANGAFEKPIVFEIYRTRGSLNSFHLSK